MRSPHPCALAAALLVLAATSASAQRRLTGRVTATTGEPVVAASVAVQGTPLGTYTGEDGRFAINNIGDGAKVIVVRHIGYKRAAVALGATQNEVEIKLERDALRLETQVITGTATTVSSVNAANAVSVVSEQDLNRVPSQTLDHALQGKVPGAIISQNSGAPGGGTQIQIRGVSTINAGFSPLYVVDGVIVSNAVIGNGLNVITQASRTNYSSSQDQAVNRIADLNPEDIETIQVLKGPSASSIYGSKGTNGVIVITTKKGAAGGAQFDVQQRLGTYRLSNKLGSRCFKSGQEFADWAANVLGDKNTAGNIVAFDAAPIKCHDYEQEFYGSDRPLSYQTNLSVRGGSGSGTTYYVGGTVQHDNGLSFEDEYNKQSLRLNVAQPIGSRVTLNASTEVLHSLTQRGISGNDNEGINPITVFSSTPSFVDMRQQADGSFPVNPYGTTNPFQNAAIVKTPENVYRLIGSVTGTLSIWSSVRQSLDLTMTGGIDSYADRARVISPATSYTEQNFNGALAGTLYNSDANILNANLNGALTHRYNASFFAATTSMGFRQEHRESEVTAITGRGVVFPTLTNVTQAAQMFPAQGQGLSKDFAMFAQEEFLTLSERLLLTAGVNSERTSNNGDPKTYYSYPKFSASYRLPTGGFMPSAIDELKLRTAWGQAGNQPTAGRFTFLTTSLYEGTTGARASTVKGAASIKPETSRETEVGFDLTMLKSRARFSATYYDKTVTDLLLQAPIAPSTGYTSQWVNGGEFENKGTELELEATPLDFGSFNWVSTTTFAQNRGKVVALPADIAPFNPGVGSFGTSFGNAWIEKGKSISAIQSYNGCNIPLPSNGRCPTANKIVALVGDANPDFNMGFGNDLGWHDVHLSTLVEWRKGGDVVNLTNNYYDAGNIAADTLTSQKRLARLRAGYPVYVENAGFVKLRELTLSYALPRSVAQRAFRGTDRPVHLEVSGRNLKTWTKYSGLDPEVSNFGNQALGRIQDVTPYPPNRSFFVAVSTAF